MMSPPTKKPQIVAHDYRNWQYEIAGLKDCFERPASMSEIQDHLDELRGYIWYGVGEDLWMQP